MWVRRLVAVTTALLLAACSGGQSPAPSATPTTQPLALVTFTIELPTAPVAAEHRAPAYISAATQSAKVIATPGSGTPSPATIFECTATSCGGSVAVPVGTDTFDVGLYSNAGGNGDLLSSGSTTYDVVAGQTNDISITFNPVVTSLAFAPVSASCTAGDACVTPVALHALDAAGDTIVGPGSYIDAAGSAITLALSTTLSGAALQTSSGTAAATSIASPDALDLAQVAYDGSEGPGTQTVTASDGNGHTATFTLTIQAPAPGAITLQDGASPTLAFLATGAAYAQTLNLSQTFSSAALTATDTCTNVGTPPATVATYTLQSTTEGSGYNASENAALTVTPTAAGSCFIVVTGTGGRQLTIAVGVTTTTIGGQ